MICNFRGNRDSCVADIILNWIRCGECFLYVSGVCVVMGWTDRLRCRRKQKLTERRFIERRATFCGAFERQKVFRDSW